jgi:hypothetical protein
LTESAIGGLSDNYLQQSALGCLTLKAEGFYIFLGTQQERMKVDVYLFNIYLTQVRKKLSGGINPSTLVINISANLR